jgi:hypothetical protein
MPLVKLQNPVVITLNAILSSILASILLQRKSNAYYRNRDIGEIKYNCEQRFWVV